MRLINLEGRHFGAWVVISYAGRSKWICRCLNCNKQYSILGQGLREGKSKRCISCYVREITTHGLTNSPTYRSWTAMWDRCTRPSVNDYHLYGGRGIRVCDRWGKFEAFLADMGLRPQNHQIGRIDTNGDYGPWNCRWETSKQNNQNRRDNTFVTLHGNRMVCREAERRLGIYRGGLGRKMRGLGWPDIEIGGINFKLSVPELRRLLQPK